MARGGFVAQMKIILGLDSAEFTQGAKKVDSETTKMSKGISSAAKLAKTALGALGAALTVDTIVRVTKQALDYTVAIKDQAREAGVTTKALQEYRYAALRAGLSNEQLTDGFKELTQKIGEAASGGKSAAAIFADAGINIRDANDHVRNAADVLPELADAYNKLGSEAEKSAFAARIFGESAGPKMKALLEQGSAGMMSYRQAAHELGMVISDTNIKKAEEAERKMDALNRVLSVKIAGFVAANAAEIERLADKLLELADAAIKAADAWSRWQNKPGGNSAENENVRIRSENRGDTVVSSGPLGSIKKVGTRGAWLPGEPGDARVNGNWVSAFRVGLPKGGRGGGRRYDGNRVNAVGAAARFGGTDWSQFTPGAAASDWIKAAKPATDLAMLSAEIAANDKEASKALAEMAAQHAPQLLRAVKGISKEAEALRDRAQSILDRLFPEQAEIRQYQEELGVLTAAMKSGQLSTEDYAKAVDALRQEFTGFAELIKDNQEIVAMGVGPTVDDALDAATASWDRFKKNLVGGAKTSRVQVVQTFGDMAQDVLSSLDRLSGAIRGGGFLDILSGIVGLGVSLGKAGAFGKSVQTNLNTPGLATGGSMILGGRSGIDRNLLSLNGSPLARVSAGERMTISPANDRGAGRGLDGQLVVRLEKDGQMAAYFEGIAGRVVTAASGAIMDGSAKVTTSRLMQRQTRRLG